MKTFLILIGLIAALAGTTAASGGMVASCKGAQLAGSFSAVKGSPGAGSISALAAVLVILDPGQWTRATARFSPDVPGTGDSQQPGPCEPTAYSLRVNARGGGTTTAKLLPPTPVCERGRLQFSAYGLG